MTQAAISQQVKALESYLGVSLFKRLPRSLELTEAALAYLPIVHDSIERLTIATDEIFGEGRNRVLRIGVSLAFFMRWLGPRLPNFRALHPEVGLAFTSNLWSADDFKGADIDIRYGHGDWHDVKSDRLTWDQLVPVCSPHLLEGDSNLAPTEILNKHTLLHVIGYEESWGHWLNKAGYIGVDITKGIQFDTLIYALEMAVLGQGFALGRTSLLSDLLESGQLITPFPEKLATDEAFYLASPVHHYHPHADIFRAWLISEVNRTRDRNNV